jgi:O-antigen/teichoic acid export membrane protein
MAHDPVATSTGHSFMKSLPRIPQVWLVAGGGWIGRGLQVSAQLIAVRILTDSLGVAGYGVFAVLASLAGWFLLSDLGIATSMQNYISERRAAGRDVDDVIVTGAMLSLISTLGSVVMLLLFGPWLADLLLGEFVFLPAWQRLLGFYAMALPGVGTALGTVAYKIWFAQHRGYLSNLLPAAGTVIATLAVWIVSRTALEPRLSWTVFLYYLPMAVLPIIVLGTMTLGSVRQRFSAMLVKPLLHRAIRFWIFGIMAAAVLQVDYIIMARVLQPKDIVIYNVASKMFMLVFFVYNALLQALWPVCSEAIARREWRGVFVMVRNYIAIGIGVTLAGGIGIALLGPWIVHVLAPSMEATIPLVVTALLTFYVMVRIWADTFAMVLQSMNDLTVFWIVVPFQSMFSIGFQIAGAHWFGLAGMIAGLICCFLLTVAWALPLRCRYHARHAALSPPRA